MKNHKEYLRVHRFEANLSKLCQFELSFAQIVAGKVFVSDSEHVGHHDRNDYDTKPNCCKSSANFFASWLKMVEV